MLQISVDITVLSRFQREAIADFILSFPTSGDDPVRPCPQMDEPSSIGSVTFPEISEDIWHPSDEQLKEANRLLRLIDGEPTTEQIEAIFRSVMS